MTAVGRLIRRHALLATWLAFLCSQMVAWPLLRGSVDDLGFRTYSSGLEEALFGTLPSLRLQDGLLTRAHDPLAWASAVVHASWFFVPLIAAVVVAIRLPRRMRSFFTWWLAIQALSLPLFALFPMEPPWMANDEVVRLNTVVLGQMSDNNPVAAMPSLHVALPVALAIWFYRERWSLPGHLLLAYAGLVGFEVVFSGEHYVIDVVAGVAAALVVAFLARLEARTTIRSARKRVARLVPSSERSAAAPLAIRIARRERAQAIIEFTLVAPVIFLFLFTIIDFGIALDRRIVVQHAVREGSRRAAVDADQNDIVDVTVAQSQNLIDPADVAICYEDDDGNGNAGDSGDNVKVSATFVYNYTMGIEDIFGAFGVSIPSGITMTPSAHMRLENSVVGGTPC